jgi:hypothetical protein
MNVCPQCFDNSILQRRLKEIRPHFPSNQRCDLHPTRKGVPIGEIGRIVDPAFRANYAIGEWRYDDQEGDDLYTVVNETTGADDDRVIQGLVAWLIDNDSYWPPHGEEAFYAEDQAYVLIKPDSWRHSSLWRQFRDDILHRQRFFNDRAKALLSEIFDGIQHQVDVTNKPAFYRLDSEDGTEFFRARIPANDDAYQKITQNSAAQMGTPPPSSRRAGRMNAAGIPVFYGAVEQDTAIAELRPAVGSLVCVARFKLLKPIHVLDLTRFTRPGKQIDIFAKNQVRRTTQWAFMQSFGAEISKPILPNDEHLEYVPAQVVSEYLTQKPVSWRGKDVVPDAIIFRSAQRQGGNNIAIMGDAASILSDTAGKGLTAEQEVKDSPVDLEFLDFSPPPSKSLDAGLQFVKDSLKQLEVTSAKFDTETHFSSPFSLGPDF